MTQQEALTLLKTGASIFLTGEPGSGKTHTVNAYVSYLREHGIEPAITASTGIAATHIGGMTLHSWSGMGISPNPDGSTRVFWREASAKRILKTKVLIIDEISMLSCEIVDMLDRICKKSKGCNEPFGGMQVIFVGDFFQLPPVIRRGDGDFTDTPSSIFAFDASSWIDLYPSVCYLTEQHRQDDTLFLGALSAIRDGSFGSSHMELFSQRKILSTNIPENLTKLFSHNIDVDRVNNSELAKLPGKKYTFTMSSDGKKNHVESLKKGCLSPERLELKVGASVMFTKNNPRLGFVNGTLGTVEGFDSATRSPIVRTQSGMRIAVSPMEWTVEENGKVRASIAQFPLRLAWALTVHKSQGMSLDSAVMDLRNVFEFGQGYVALSRVRRLSGLHLLGWNDKTFHVHPEILQKDREFRGLSDTFTRQLSQLKSDEVAKQQEDFIRSCGGSVQKQKITPKTVETKSKKVPTHITTFDLWNSGKTLEQISEIRKLKRVTLLSHIKKLLTEKKIKKSELIRLLSPKLLSAQPEILSVFQKLDTQKLSPVHEYCKGKFSYEELRVVRMLLGE